MSGGTKHAQVPSRTSTQSATSEVRFDDSNPHITPGAAPSQGHSSTARTGRQDPVVQTSSDERRELYEYPRRMFPAWRTEIGLDPRPDVNMSGTKLSSPALVNNSTRWGQPDFHADVRGRSYGGPEGKPPTRMGSFSTRAHAVFLESQSLPDAAQMADVARIGDERGRPARGNIDSSINVHQKYQRRVSSWRAAQYQPVKTKLKGL